MTPLPEHKTLLDLIAGADDHPALLAPDRFGPEYQLEEKLRAECRWQYAHQYSAP